MNTTWKNFLIQQGANYSDNHEARFTSPYESSDIHLFDLSYRALLKITGADACTFLHGQFSNDLNSLKGVSSQISSYSNPKGRLLSIFRIIRVNDFYLISLPADIAKLIAKRLQMFIMRADVRIEEISADWANVGVSGNGTDSLLQGEGHTIANEGGCANWDEASSTLIVRVADESTQFEIYSPNENMIPIWKKLCKLTTPTSTTYWKLQHIQEGRAEVYAATQASFIAQMVNLQITGAVNFKKGCYPGQEIIARLQYLGKLKRKMYHYEVDADIPPVPGSEVFVADTDECSGTVVESASVPRGGVEVLLVLKVEDVDAGRQMQLEGSGGFELQRLSLPYNLEE